MKFSVLGPFEVRDPDGRVVDLGGPRQRAVLAALLVDANRVLSVDRLVDSVWGESPPPAAVGSLHAYISNLRRALEPGRPPRTPSDRLITQPPGYLLRVGEDDLDAARFDRLVRHGAACLDEGRPADAWAAFDAALGLWRGTPYAEFSYSEFAGAEIARLNEVYEQAREGHAAALVAAGRETEAIPALEKLVAEQPLRERPRALLALALYRAGRQADALRALDEARRTLRDELGLDPGPSFRQLEQQILDHDPALVTARIEPPPAAAAPQAAPDAAASAAARPFVGRAAALSRLDGELAAAGRGIRIVVVSGEPGIGKTRLAEELARRAAAGGWAVAWGRAHEDEVGAPLWPWRQALDSLGQPPPPPPDASAVATADQAAAARMRLFEAHAAAVAAAAASQPAIVVLDDLQWADSSTKRLLRFLAAERPARPLLVVATWRSSADDAGVLGDLARFDHVSRIELDPLGPADVADYLGAVTGRPADAGLAAALADRTGGNPFFLGELVELLVSEDRLAGDGRVGEGTADAVPQKVRDVVRSRMARLPEDARTLLGVAAAAFDRFSVDLLAATTGLDVERVLDLLDAAVAIGLVADADGPGWFRFRHQLIADVLYADLTTARRSRLHQRVAEALTAMGARAADIARQWAAVGTAEAAAAAVRHAQDAADAAAAALGYDEAAAWLGRALAIVDTTPGLFEPAQRRALLVRLGRARWLAGDLAGSHAAVDAALAVAQSLDDAVAIAETAVSYGGLGPWLWRDVGLPAPHVVAALSSVLPTVEAEHPALAVRVRARLAAELYAFPDRADDSVAHARAAVAAAEALGDPALVAEALQSAVLATLRPTALAEHAELARRMAALDEAPAAALVGRLLSAVTDLVQAQTDLDTLGRVLDRCHADARALGQPFLQLPIEQARATVAAVRGDVVAAEAFGARALALHEQLGWVGSDGVRLAHLHAVRSQQGRTAELADDAVRLARTSPLDIERLYGALVALEAGHRDLAAEVVAADGDPPPPSWHSVFQLSVAAELCARLGGPDALARRCYDALLPYAETVVVMGSGVACRGPAARYLALLAHSLGDDTAASAHEAAAAEITRRIGAVPAR